jgi:hypothetical protein
MQNRPPTHLSVNWMGFFAVGPVAMLPSYLFPARSLNALCGRARFVLESARSPLCYATLFAQVELSIAYVMKQFLQYAFACMPPDKYKTECVY